MYELALIILETSDVSKKPICFRNIQSQLHLESLDMHLKILSKGKKKFLTILPGEKILMEVKKEHTQGKAICMATSEKTASNSKKLFVNLHAANSTFCIQRCHFCGQ